MKRRLRENAVGDSGAGGGIRTPDQLVRSQLLYPAELRAQFVLLNGNKLIFVQQKSNSR